ncbi:MAG: sugar phosphate isomerase/epimerase family protein [Gammaproteobacteria bacterium]
MPHNHHGAGVELLASYWTIAGGAIPHTGPEYSPFDFRDRVEACAKAGFRGMGFWHADIEHILESRTVTEMKHILDDNGIKHVELEFITGWFSDGKQRKESDRIRKLLLGTAETLEARHIKIGDFIGAPCPMERLIEEYSKLCAEGVEHGTDIVFELIPWSTPGDLDEALVLVEGAGAANGGLMVDIWHFHSLKIPNTTTEKLPLKYLKGVEINDGPAQISGDWSEQTVNHRLLCGEGEFDIKGLIKAVQNAGYEGPYGIEVLNKSMRSWPLDKLVTSAYETTLAMF